MTDVKAVVVGVLASTVYIAALLWLPGMAAARLVVLPLLLATGLVAGAAASLAAADGPRVGAWHGLLSGTVAGGLVAAITIYTFSIPGASRGAFRAANSLVATAAGSAPVVAEHGPLVLAVLAGLGWAVIAALGLYAGRRAPLREGTGVIGE